MNNSYKYFKKGDKIVSIKPWNRCNLMGVPIGSIPEFYLVYTFRMYASTRTWPFMKIRPHYGLMFTEETDLIFDGKCFMYESEYKRMKLLKLKRKILFKKIFNKLIKHK